MIPISNSKFPSLTRSDSTTHFFDKKIYSLFDSDFFRNRQFHIYSQHVSPELYAVAKVINAEPDDFTEEGVKPQLGLLGCKLSLSNSSLKQFFFFPNKKQPSIETN